MRVLPKSQQKAILEDLLTDIPVHFDFLFSDSHAEVISGKQEGVYAWIGINFVLGRFEHIEEDEEAVVEVSLPGSENSKAIIRKRTAGILDMGGVSTQIAYEVPETVSFASLQQVTICTNCLLLVWFSFNMSPFIFVLFPESDTTLLCLPRCHLLSPGGRRQEDEAGSAKPQDGLRALRPAGLFLGLSFSLVYLVSCMLQFLLTLSLQSLLFSTGF